MTIALVAIFRLAGYLTDPRPTDDEIHRIGGEPARIREAPVRRSRSSS